jgi:GNAT superfamily N-acetyltransferase
LFNDFRVFYGFSADLQAARDFIESCLRGHQTHFVLAFVDSCAVGFAHLIPYWDTLEMKRAWILEDFFVRPEIRRRGVGTALLQHAERIAKTDGAVRLTLTTAHTNSIAQRLYEANGYVKDDVFRIYNLRVN